MVRRKQFATRVWIGDCLQWLDILFVCTTNPRALPTNHQTAANAYLDLSDVVCRFRPYVYVSFRLKEHECFNYTNITLPPGSKPTLSMLGMCKAILPCNGRDVLSHAWSVMTGKTSSDAFTRCTLLLAAVFYYFLDSRTLIRTESLRSLNEAVPTAPNTAEILVHAMANRPATMTAASPGRHLLPLMFRYYRSFPASAT
jgi:hypothetical protein